MGLKASIMRPREQNTPFKVCTAGAICEVEVLISAAGVMRFLQIEWHNHERARNSWDIERAEMKGKIAKQEGEGRQAKRINEQLERQIRMLEFALKNERAKAKKLGNGEPVEPAADSIDAAILKKGGESDLRNGVPERLQRRECARRTTRYAEY